MKNNILTSIVTLGALVCLFLLTDPFMVLMTTPLQMLVLLIASLLLALIVAFVITEKATDERDHLHRMEAGRAGYSAGLVVLIVALVVQGLSHHIDMWISATIAVMLLTKFGTRVFDTFKK
jgi:hypothetical protein